MLTFLLGVSFTFNGLFIALVYLYLKVKEHKELKDGNNYIEDIEMAMDFMDGQL